MFLRAVVYSKVTEVKLMLYDSDPNNAKMTMKYNTFRSMNPMYGRERKFSKSISKVQCTISIQMSMQTIINQMKILYVSLSILQQSLKFDFSMFSKRQKQVF
jgi:hypothetical protein